ncbi:uncharacterized protein LOC126898420 isoform X2 [Daktulosphaira vitifoliae]|uniref:uncharacterized protein LOC126898420 isoform X2 n=1 Tax=Daktulosphaira vitifoliae TaxID=58002 RepID=UPI0021A999EE|nr:uncharacterized protein LOC126898420 isoform X2 [Daktulosphaira vitifoliae]
MFDIFLYSIIVKSYTLQNSYDRQMKKYFSNIEEDVDAIKSANNRLISKLTTSLYINIVKNITNGFFNTKVYPLKKRVEHGTNHPINMVKRNGTSSNNTYRVFDNEIDCVTANKRACVCSFDELLESIVNILEIAKKSKEITSLKCQWFKPTSAVYIISPSPDMQTDNESNDFNMMPAGEDYIELKDTSKEMEADSVNVSDIAVNFDDVISYRSVNPPENNFSIYHGMLGNDIKIRCEVTIPKNIVVDRAVYDIRSTAVYTTNDVCTLDIILPIQLQLPNKLQTDICSLGSLQYLCSVIIDTPKCIGDKNKLEINYTVRVNYSTGFMKQIKYNKKCQGPVFYQKVLAKIWQVLAENLNKSMTVHLMTKLSTIRKNFEPNMDRLTVQNVVSCLGGFGLLGIVCVACPVHHYSPNMSAECIKCPKGYHQLTAGSEKCVKCPTIFASGCDLGHLYPSFPRYYGYIMMVFVFVLTFIATVLCFGLHFFQNDKNETNKIVKKKKKKKKKEKKSSILKTNELSNVDMSYDNDINLNKHEEPKTPFQGIHDKIGNEINQNETEITKLYFASLHEGKKSPHLGSVSEKTTWITTDSRFTHGKQISNKSLKMKSHHQILLSNSNMTEPCVIGNDKYCITNTCAFNSIVFAITAMYYDSLSYKAYIEKSENELLKFVKELALNGSTQTVYNKRAELLKKYFTIHKLYQSVYMIDAQCNVSKIVTCYFKDEPSVTEILSCASCCEITRHSPTIVLQAVTENCKINMLQSLLDIYLAKIKHLCKICGKQNISFKKCNKHIFIETDQFSSILLEDIPKILNKKYRLVAIINYVSAHYVCFINRSSTGLWEIHNDLKKRVQTLKKSNVTLNPHILVYLKLKSWEIINQPLQKKEDLLEKFKKSCLFLS